MEPRRLSVRRTEASAGAVASDDFEKALEEISACVQINPEWENGVQKERVSVGAFFLGKKEKPTDGIVVEEKRGRQLTLGLGKFFSSKEALSSFILTVKMFILFELFYL